MTAKGSADLMGALVSYRHDRIIAGVRWRHYTKISMVIVARRHVVGHYAKFYITS